MIKHLMKGAVPVQIGKSRFQLGVPSFSALYGCQGLSDAWVIWSRLERMSGINHRIWLSFHESIIRHKRKQEKSEKIPSSRSNTLSWENCSNHATIAHVVSQIGPDWLPGKCEESNFSRRHE